MRCLTPLWLSIALVGCQTVPTSPIPPGEAAPEAVAELEVATSHERARALPPPPPLASRPPEAPTTDLGETLDFASVRGWSTLDAAPALAAFKRSCEAWSRADGDAFLSPKLPQYGRFRDWRPACEAAGDADQPRRFFEAYFRPVALDVPDAEEGLLTGYYEPELDVRRTPTPEFSEPILTRPASKSALKRPRAEVEPGASEVIAYGRPIDVFFMQIQGSGRLAFADGTRVRAAFGGHNGHPYTSIGRTLVEWGELDAGKASKAAIEVWMARAGAIKARHLMNQNRRYIYFEVQDLPPGTGPDGAMRVPLTAMGSMALDPAHHPYGTLAVLDTRLPTRARDFQGRPRQILVVGQDTGGAIKGPLRGDLFFGAGPKAGAKAGVMKHGARWTLLLPRGMDAVPDADLVASLARARLSP